MHFSGRGKIYFTLYLFALFHELVHLGVAALFGMKARSIHIFPWGCMLSLENLPAGKKSFFVYLAGPLFNLCMYFFGICPTENLSLALFNLIPVMPLDGGMAVNIIFTRLTFYISIVAIVFITLASIYFKASLLLPIVLMVLLYIGEKNKLDANIAAGIIGYFNAKK